MPTCPIIVLAKAPVAGFAKTRLIPALGAAGAAALAERLLVHAVTQALAAKLGPVDLCCTPDAQHPVFARLGRRPGVTLSVQDPGDLGERMATALARWLTPQPTGAGRPAPMALLIGTDVPALDAALLRRAAAALGHADTGINTTLATPLGADARAPANADAAPAIDAVFVPTHDGGYALVGLRRPAPSLFDHMTWSTPTVMAHTRQRLSAAGLRHRELPPVADIDEPADLAHLPADWLP